LLVTHFKGFTFVAEKLSADELVGEIDHCFSNFDRIISNFKVEKIKTIGDAYTAAAGLPEPCDGHADEMVLAALEIRDFVLNYKKEREAEGRVAFEIHIGLRSGPVVAGIVGVKKFAYDIWGDTENTAARM
jgi:adenylate cyclase